MKTQKQKTLPAPRWSLDEIYTGPKDPQIQKDLLFIRKKAEEFAKKYRGKVGKLDLNALIKALNEYEVFYRKIFLILTYPELAFTVDTKNSNIAGLLQKKEVEISEIQNGLVFFGLELAKHPKLKSFIDDNKATQYRCMFQKMLQSNEHLLTEAQEQLLNTVSVTSRSGWIKLFVQMDAAVSITYKGQKLNREQALKHLHSGSRKERQAIFEALSEQFKSSATNFVHIFNMLLLDKMQEDKMRKYAEPESARNDSNGLTKKAVDTLVSVTHQNIDLVKRFYKTKQKLLGLKEMYPYDRYAPVGKVKSEYTFKQASDMVDAALSGFDPSFGKIFRDLLKNKHIDAQVSDVKRGGAYCAGMPKGHLPYILMNFCGEPRDIQTLAHETGHAVHDVLIEDLPLMVTHPSFPVAETASVFAEMVMFDHLVKNTKNEKEKLVVFAEKIEDTFSTIFRQLSFLSFERKAHGAMKAKGEVSSDELNNFWLESQKEFYGSAFKYPKGYEYWWSYVSHFYEYPFYVYAYAFGNLLVFALWQEYKLAKQSGDQKKVVEFLAKYKNLLGKGGTRTTFETLKESGYDPEDPKFWQKGYDALSDLIGDFEKMC